MLYHPTHSRPALARPPARALARFISAACLLLGCLLALAACGAASSRPTPSPIPRFLALGDSYTIGHGLTPPDRWPNLLRDQLTQANLPLQPPRIIAVTGYTTADLLSALDRESIDGPFDLVSLMIGVNDQYRRRPIADFERGFAELLRRSLAFAGGRPAHVLVLSIPDWGLTPYGQRANVSSAAISAEIDQFNAVSRTATLAAGANWIDVTTTTRRLATNPAMFAPDGLHYSRQMHTLWAAQALPIAKAALATPRRGKN